MLSKQTIIGLLQDFVPSTDIELERLANEREESISFMEDNFDSHEPVTDEEDQTEEDVEVGE